jgi:hypothetical protein
MKSTKGTRFSKMGGKFMAKSKIFPPSTVGQKQLVAFRRSMPTKSEENA